MGTDGQWLADGTDVGLKQETTHPREGEQSFFSKAHCAGHSPCGRNFHYTILSAICQEKNCTKIQTIEIPELCKMQKIKEGVDKRVIMWYNRYRKKEREIETMTIKTITTQLDRISADSWYDVTDNHIDLTINDFEGFDENWSEVDREFVDADAVEEVLEWLEKNADCVDGDFYRYYHFGEIVVEVGYTSFDI